MRLERMLPSATVAVSDTLYAFLYAPGGMRRRPMWLRLLGHRVLLLSPRGSHCTVGYGGTAEYYGRYGRVLL